MIHLGVRVDDDRRVYTKSVRLAAAQPLDKLFRELAAECRFDPSLCRLVLRGEEVERCRSAEELGLRDDGAIAELSFDANAPGAFTLIGAVGARRAEAEAVLHRRVGSLSKQQYDLVQSTFHHAAATNRVELMRAMLSPPSHVDLNARDREEGCTALHDAAACTLAPNAAAVRLLLEAGCDATLRCRRGFTALEVAQGRCRELGGPNRSAAAVLRSCAAPAPAPPPLAPPGSPRLQQPRSPRGAAGGVRVGAVVRIGGLQTEAGARHNGSVGLVLATPSEATRGRFEVRVTQPRGQDARAGAASGKLLRLSRDKLTPIGADEAHAGAASGAPRTPPEPSGAKPACEVCGAVSMTVCSGCGAARFCSPGCQKAAWRRHKAVCVRAPSLRALGDRTNTAHAHADVHGRGIAPKGTPVHGVDGLAVSVEARAPSAGATDSAESAIDALD